MSRRQAASVQLILMTVAALAGAAGLGVQSAAAAVTLQATLAGDGGAAGDNFGSSGAISSDITRFGHQSTRGGCSASHGSAAAARAIHSSTSRSTANVQPSSSVCTGRRRTAIVILHSAG